MRSRQFIVALALGAGAIFASAGVSTAQTPTQDSVTGGGVSAGNCGGNVEVNAQSGPSGENPTGFVSCGTLFSGPVLCLAVTANVAIMTVQTLPFGIVGVRITDTGTTGDIFEAFPAFAGGGCPDPLSSYSQFDFTGDFVVVDAQPLPTSKEQCKHGGWRTYGVFRNQGHCIRFVNTGRL